MIRINILTRYSHRLFDQQIDRQRYTGHIEFQENSREDIDWDCVVVFDGIPERASIRVAEGALLFIAGEPPDAIRYTAGFLAQFDGTFCAHPSAARRARNRSAQYFNNWHFGFDASTKQYRYGFDDVQQMVPPKKTKDLSVIMSSLAYMPNHLKRLQFLQALQQRFGDRVDVFGRGRSFIPYKDDAILPYRFHVCIENCQVPDLWTEKIADPLLGYSVPAYAGCPNITRYFPEDAIVPLNLDDHAFSLTQIQRILDAPEAEYQRRLPAIRQAREQLLGEYNLISWLAGFVGKGEQPPPAQRRALVPNEQTLGYSVENSLLRGRRLAFRKCFQWSQRLRAVTRSA
jgi:hypothetical protein